MHDTDTRRNQPLRAQLFEIASEQGGSTLNVFAEQSTDRNLVSWQWVPEALQEIPA